MTVSRAAPEHFSEGVGLADSSAGPLAGLAFALLGIGLPVAMVLANKSAPVFVTLATLVALAAVYRAGLWNRFARQATAAVRTPVGLASIAFAGFGAASLVWSIDPGTSARSLVATLLMTLVGVAAAAAFPLLAERRSGWFLVGGLAVASAVAIFEGRSGMRLHVLLHERPYTFDLKRSCDVLSLLALPALAFLIPRRRYVGAVLLAALVVLAAVGVNAGTATFGLVVAALVWLGARFAPRSTSAGVGLVILALMAIAPVFGTATTDLLPKPALALLAHSHANERMAIWQAFESRWRDRPWLGYGFDASAEVSKVARPEGVAPDPVADGVIERIHPHNGFLQIWVEFGPLGALIGAVVLMLALMRVVGDGSAHMPARLALLAGSIVMALVGFGLWQAWWNALVGAAIVWLMIARVEDPEAIRA